MNMMRHCRQCRADAVGLLGEDRGEEFTLDKIEAMDIDYAAAMVKRAAIHAAIKEELDEKAAKKARLAAMSVPAADDTPAKRYRPVLMAVATSGGGLINQHYGHATEFLVYEASASGVRFIGHRKVDQYCVGNDSCGEQESALAGGIRALKGCEAVLCSKIGYEPWGLLEAAGIQPNGEHAMEPIEEAVLAVYQEMIASGRLAQDEAPLRANA
jgi:nitrogen fixation protein NifB